MDRLITLYEEMIQQKTVDEMLGKVRAAVKIHVEEGPFMLAAVNGLPSLVVARPNMRNIRDMAYTGSWGTGAPARHGPADVLLQGLTWARSRVVVLLSNVSLTLVSPASVSDCNGRRRARVGAFIVRRLLHTLPLLLVISVAVFAVISLPLGTI